MFQGASGKVCSLIIWCFILLVTNVNSQGYYYKSSNVNQYQIVNGKYELVTTTTPPPTLLETIFPWMGDAYDSSKTPEEDDAILNSISDLNLDSSNVSPTVTDSEGIFSWFSLPSLPGIPGFGSSETTEESPSPNGAGMGGPPPPSFPPQGPMGPPPPGMDLSFEASPPNQMDFHSAGAAPSYPMGLYDNFDSNALNFQNGLMIGSASQNEPMMLPPPSGGHMQMGHNPIHSSQYPPMPSPNAIPYEIRNNLNPTFQFHQNVKDSIPIPNPSLPGVLSQPPPMLPYAYSASFQYGTKGATNERPLSQSFIDTISSYFNFGKRSDLDETPAENKKNVPIEARSDANEMYYSGDQGTIDLRDWTSFVEKAGDDSDIDANDDSSNVDDENSGKVAAPSDILGNKSADIKDFPCPKSGIWRWNGEVCIAVGPVPVWACKPNDLTVSGKIAICRNKIYFSPKVINKNLNVPHHLA